jgi:hypothetical protein
MTVFLRIQHTKVAMESIEIVDFIGPAVNLWALRVAAWERDANFIFR